MLKHKNETFDKFCSFKRLVENQTGLKIKTFRSDNCTEFDNKHFIKFFDDHGIEHETSIVYKPQQNGLAERTIRTLTEKARCMLQDANLPKKFWAEAVNTAAYIKNHTTSKVIGNKSPIEIWSGKKPDLSHFKVFGSVAMAMIPKEKRKKFDAKSKQLIFVGYCENQKGYRLLDMETNQIVACRDVTVMEHPNDFVNLDKQGDEFKFIFDDEISENGVPHSQNSVGSTEATIQSNDNGVSHSQNSVDSINIETELQSIENGVPHIQNSVGSINVTPQLNSRAV